MAKQKRKKRQSTQADLMLALNITEDDLATNQEGFISDAQRHNLYRYLRRDFWDTLLVLCLTLGFALFFIYLGNEINFYARIGWLIMGIGVLQIWVTIIKQMRTRQEIHEDKVAYRQGIATLQDVIVISIDDQKLNTTYKVVQHMYPAEHYLAYYLPKTKRIVSLLHLPQDAYIHPSQASQTGDEIDSDEIREESTKA